MESKVVSAEFRGWYPDGITRETLIIGDIRNFGKNTDGLVKAGLIEPIAAPDKSSEQETVIEATTAEPHRSAVSRGRKNRG